jgi:putative membrane protein
MLVENAKVEATADDKSFVGEAATGGLMEVELGRYAEQNALNPRVKNFGAMMVRDHSKANDELKAIAAGKNISFPATMDDSQMNIVNDLKTKSGADFDKEYMKEMVDDHERDVDKFKKESEDGTDAEIKAFASKTLPILNAHQDSAKSIRDALNNKNSK